MQYATRFFGVRGIWVRGFGLGVRGVISWFRYFVISNLSPLTFHLSPLTFHLSPITLLRICAHDEAVEVAADEVA